MTRQQEREKIRQDSERCFYDVIDNGLLKSIDLQQAEKIKDACLKAYLAGRRSGLADARAEAGRQWAEGYVLRALEKLI